MESKEDIEIIRKVLSGDRNAYAGIVRKYQDRVLRLCLSLLTNPTRAEEAAQESFIKAYQSLKQFKGRSSFSTWIYRIAYFHCLDSLRKETREKTESWDALLEREGDRIHRLFSVPTGSGSGERTSELVEQALFHLSEEYRNTLILREVQELSYKEISETMDCSVDSVKARLKRARAELKEKLRHFMKPQNV